MKIEIRDAVPDDATILSEAEQAQAKTPGQVISHPDELRAKSFEATILNLSASDNGKYVVALSNGQIVGHALLDPMPLKAIRHVARLTIVVHPGWEGKGVGKMMLTYLLEWGRQNLIVEKIELWVRASNLRAIEIYKKVSQSAPEILDSSRNTHLS